MNKKRWNGIIIILLVVVVLGAGANVALWWLRGSPLQQSTTETLKGASSSDEAVLSPQKKISKQQSWAIMRQLRADAVDAAQTIGQTAAQAKTFGNQAIETANGLINNVRKD